MLPFLLTLLIVSTLGAVIDPTDPFVCEGDGHFGDENDCTRFYHCANGRPMPLFCPAGLFWSKASAQCDWPEKSDCEFTVEKARRLQESNPTRVYLTFDDGPGEGTTEVLDALKEFDVPATFFINTKQLTKSDPKNPDQLAINANNLVRLVTEGHVLADHSFNHMKHNSQGPKNAYLDIENDLGYFGVKNTHPALAILYQAGFDDQTLLFVNHTMSNLVRMPYTNNWRVLTREGKALVENCPACTIPAASAAKAIQIANILAYQGKQIFGWDLEWNMNFNIGRLRYDGNSMFRRLGTGANAKSKGKLVVLAHDYAFRPHEITGGTKEMDKLRDFLKLASEAGYQFRTLDTYYQD